MQENQTQPSAGNADPAVVKYDGPAITNDHLVCERPHPLGGGVQRIYRFADGHGLSLVDSPVLHNYPFAWEAAVLCGVTGDGDFKELVYDTGLTQDVEVFMSNEEANLFIAKAALHFKRSGDRDTRATSTTRA